MENTTTGQFFFFATVLGLICSVTTTLLAIIQTKVMVASLAHGWQRTRLAIGTWLATIFFFVGALTHGFMTNPSVIVKALTKKNEVPQQNSCPCPEATKTEQHPSPVNRDSPSSTPVSTHKNTDSFSGTYFAVKGIKLRGPNALMGNFVGTCTVEDGGANIVIPSPDLRLASDADTWGARKITGGEVIIGDYDELAKIASDRGGVANWREHFELDEVRDHGQQSVAKRSIQVYVPQQIAKVLSNKAILFKIDNELISTHRKLVPAFALSERRVFSGR